jgi:large subunit ribosomal protein L17
MKHGKKFRSLSRSKSHRKALLGNLASELIKHKRIKTTLAKGKELRKIVEPIINRAKTDTTHSRRMVFKALLNNEQAKGLVTELFRDIAPKIADRPGGYTRVIKLPPRLGDNAPMCYIELVDYNELLLNEQAAPVKKTRRSRKSGTAKKDADTEATVTEDKVDEAETKVADKLDGEKPATETNNEEE